MPKKSENLPLNELQERLKKYAAHKKKLAEKKELIKQVEDKLKIQEDFLAKQLISNKLTKVEIEGVGVFKPVTKVNYHYPSSGKEADRKKFIKWVNTHMGANHANKLLIMTYQTVTALQKGAVENKWLKEGQNPPGITFKKTSIKLSLTKK